MWNTYTTGAIQSGNHIQYCKQHNIPYRTFQLKYQQYNIFNIPNNNKPVREHINRYTGTESGSMNNNELIKLIEDIIVEHTQDQPAALFLDSLGYQYNDHTTQICNKNNISVYRRPANFATWLKPWLQPCCSV